MGQPDILVNNVGGSMGTSDVVASSIDDFNMVIDLNLWSALRMIKLLLPGMIERGWGRIINISSIYGREAGGTAPYMTAKAAMIALSKHAALSSAEKRCDRQLRRTRINPVPRRNMGKVPTEQHSRSRSRVHRPQPTHGQIRMARAYRRNRSFLSIETSRPDHRYMHKRRRWTIPQPLLSQRYTPHLKRITLAPRHE